MLTERSFADFRYGPIRTERFRGHGHEFGSTDYLPRVLADFLQPVRDRIAGFNDADFG
mgnify:CR=1 FL=1